MKKKSENRNREGKSAYVDIREMKGNNLTMAEITSLLYHGLTGNQSAWRPRDREGKHTTVHNLGWRISLINTEA